MPDLNLNTLADTDTGATSARAGFAVRFRERSRLQSRAWRIAFIYAVFAILWIYYSDQTLAFLIPDPGQLIRWSVYKGIAFVVLTSILLLILMLRTFGSIESGYIRLRSHKAEIERINRLYSALSHVNQAIVWSSNRDELFQKVCQVLVEHGGFSMAWVGWQDPAVRTLTPVAAWGAGKEYVDNIVIYTDDRVEGRGPTGKAFREGQPFICNDIMHDPATVPWREKARLHNYCASAAFPVRENGKVRGILSVYANTVDFFRKNEITLLVEAAQDVSFALDNFARDQDRIEAEALAHKESHFSQAMIESMPGILYFYNDQGQFLRWNRNFEQVSGYSADEIRQMHPLQFFASEDQQSLQQRINEVFVKGESSAEAPFLAKDGTATPYYFTGRRVEFDGTPCLVGVGIDISERLQAEMALRESEQRYRTTLDNMLEGCQLIGFDWRYLYLNHQAALQNRRPNTEFLYRTMQECWPGLETTVAYTLLRRCMEERIAVHEDVEFAFPDGYSSWFELRSQPVPEGIFILSVDITERKQAEAALRNLNASLEHKVRERTKELEIAVARAESADRIKLAFLATMSHELRTPLNSIIGFTGIILQGLTGPLNPEQTKQLGMVRGSARHLLDLINDVLDLSKIEAGQLEVRAELFDLDASIKQVIQSVKPLADKKGLTLVAGDSAELPEMTGDRRRVEQVLINLLGNAIKFTERGEVTLTVDVVDEFRLSPDAAAVRAVRLQVADTGIGIKSEDLPKLFQPFHQLDSGLSRTHEGTGLGLAICRRLTSLMGGNITATSEWASGSKFTVTLPIQMISGVES